MATQRAGHMHLLSTLQYLLFTLYHLLFTPHYVLHLLFTPQYLHDPSFLLLNTSGTPHGGTSARTLGSLDPSGWHRCRSNKAQGPPCAGVTGRLHLVFTLYYLLFTPHYVLRQPPYLAIIKWLMWLNPVL